MGVETFSFLVTSSYIKGSKPFEERDALLKFKVVLHLLP